MASSNGRSPSQPQLQQHPPPNPHQRQVHRPPPSTTSAATSPPTVSKSHRHSLPFSFPPLFQSNTSSASLVPSTAEGKPIPVDDSTAEHRTSALRELNTNFPSRHRYAKSTGAQSSTYSQPVIVRSYYPPLPSRPVSTGRGPFASRGGIGRRAGSDTGPAAVVRRVLPFAARVTPSGNGMLGSMARTRAKKRMDGPDEAKLPPLDAFRFKSFMANMEEHGQGTNINADLDRIAEICAKSRYSLSNQYEVHYSPHGSGSSFLSNGNQIQESQGPTLQAISSEDERNMRRARRRPIGARRNSRAMGTLETIMSSSRSSDEDRSKKKPAAELADEVRGRASRKDLGTRSSTSSSQSGLDDSSQPEEEIPHRKPRSRRSGSLALIDVPRHSLSNELTDPMSSVTGLLGEPALPQTSSSQLEIRTVREAPPKESFAGAPETRITSPEWPFVQGSISHVEDGYSGHGIFSAWSSWMPWHAPETLARPHGRAEGSLRELLRTTDVKGKGIERAM